MDWTAGMHANRMVRVNGVAQDIAAGKGRVSLKMDVMENLGSTQIGMRVFLHQVNC